MKKVKIPKTPLQELAEKLLKMKAEQQSIEIEKLNNFERKAINELLDEMIEKRMRKSNRILHLLLGLTITTLTLTIMFLLNIDLLINIIEYFKTL